MVYTWDRMIYTCVPPVTLMVPMIHPGGVGEYSDADQQHSWNL